MIVDGLKCLICNDVIWSKHRHDFKWCKCNECAIDGGRDYIKVSGDPLNYKVISVDTDTNKEVNDETTV